MNCSTSAHPLLRPLHSLGALGVLFLLVAFGLTSCGESGSSSAVGSGPNVLLVTLDTTRADRIGCYGHEAARTPVIDRLASRGLRFEDAFCQVPLTLPSHISLLTGTYPAVNGVRINGGGMLTEATPSMARVFKDRGYRTGGFTSITVLHSSFGLGQGFDVYSDVYEGKSLRNTGRTRSMRPANETCDRLLEWLDQPSDKPFFAWLHFFDAHLPLNPPPPFNELLEDPYDGEIAFTDQEIGRVIAWLEREDELDNTIVIVTSDHGEALGDHGEDEHGLFLYSATTRVPLVISAPGLLPEGQVVQDAVSLVALAPTLFEILDWSVGHEMDGQSFAGSWQGESWQATPTFSETEYPRLGYGWSSLRALTSADWLYISSPEPELYHRREDRDELVDVIAEHPDVAAELELELDALEASMVPRVESSATLTAEERAALESLGYVRTSSPGDAIESGRNPKDMVAVSNGYLQALNVYRKADYAAAIELLEPLVAQSPESDAIHGTLANAYLKVNRFEDAAREFELSLRSNPKDTSGLFGLGESTFQLNQLERAKTALELTIEIDDSFGQAHSRLGMIAARKGDMQGALRHFQDFVRVDPDSVSARCNLGNALMQMGKFKEAVVHFLRANELDSSSTRAHVGLWNAVRSGALERSRATDLLRTAISAHPTNLELKARLAWALGTDARGQAEQISEATRIAQELVSVAPQAWWAQDTLGVCLAASGDFPAASQAARLALDLAKKSRNRAAGEIAKRVQLYEKRTRYAE